MLIKFESKSNRVKGLAFHPKRPWILAALHNGSVQWWDYRMAALLDRFDEHEGPVRGVAFHMTQPLFVSGGDDYKVKVWNHKQQRCLFTLLGHLDFIRCVQFHHQHPWILSTSDDHTIRIWNWQSRTCISIVTGHNHYVMSAQFHPRDDLIVSASLDFTLRIWDFSGLKKKHSAPGTVQSFEEQRQQGQDMFGNMDVVVKSVLEGHDKGINWAAFHPVLPLIVSCADDRQVKLWRMSETKAWEIDTFRGHYNSISGVCFHAKQELVISVAEDKTIRVWDMVKRTSSQTFRREHDRFWALAAHPELKLFAAGHDNGLLVFKLERERSSYIVHQNSLFYVRDKALRHLDYTTGDDVSVAIVKRGKGVEVSPRTISYNPTEKSVLLSVPVENGVVEYYQLQKDQRSFRETSSEPKKFYGSTGMFVARNRFAILEKDRQKVTVYDSKTGSNVKEVEVAIGATDIFYAGIGHLLVTAPAVVQLLDVQQGSVVSEIAVASVKYVAWAPDMSMVALLGKHTITITGKRLEQLALINETVRVKSAAWDDCGVLVYTTLNHIKYTLSQGDNGIIRTLEHPLYVTRVSGTTVYCLDREAKMRLITIDPTEYRFKLALVRRDYEQVLHIINNSNLVGQSIISYLQKKGYPEVALHFVQDPATRFELALECGNLDMAVETAKTIDNPELWHQLAVEALRQGNVQTVEMAYQRVKNFERLSFLYLITANTRKLEKMMKIAEVRGDTMSRFNNALLLSNVQERIKILRETGQYSLAYLTAKTNGIDDLAEEIRATAGVDQSQITGVEPGKMMTGLVAIIAEPDKNWPMSSTVQGYFDGGISIQDTRSAPAAGGFSSTVDEEASGWGADETPDAGLSEVQRLSGRAGGSNAIEEMDDHEESWGMDRLDLNLPTNLPGGTAALTSPASQAIMPMQGPNIRQLWARNSNLAVDHIASGAFESAMQLLNRQLGITNFIPLKPFFMVVFQSTSAYLTTLPCVSPLSVPLHRNWTESDTLKLLPRVSGRIETLLNSDIQDAYRNTSANKLSEALTVFERTLYSVLFVVTDSPAEFDKLRTLVSTCREYIIGIKMELARRELVQDRTSDKRSIELAAYFTECKMQPMHVQLALRSAMQVAYKAQNCASAAMFARRLLELNPPATAEQKARQLISVCEQTPNDAIAIDYDPLGHYVTCAASFTVIARGDSTVTCPYCTASYKPSFKGNQCHVCKLTKIGDRASGLVRQF